MSKPIDAQAVDIPDRWVVAPTSCVVSREPPTSAFQVSKSLSHVYSFNATSSTGSLVLSRNTSELLSTLGGNPVNDALHFFDHWLPWTRSTTGIQSSREPHRHGESFVPGTEPIVTAPFVFHGYRGSYGEVDGKGRAIPAPLDVRHDIHSANSEAVRFAPGPKELASLVLRFNAEESSYTALLNQGEYGTLYGDTGVSVCSDRHSDKGGTDMVRVCELRSEFRSAADDFPQPSLVTQPSPPSPTFAT
ncbi:uncharacterized protein EI90DRAFT_3035624 [Cantharellus anzutake]|uniref:uncharacterized protein n=1 Tax=Cantharellus anzutake TaxID=1750568 RepID=UPI0019076CC2|nr:uncharacterized protein EI90DRAFT_3035624 [Cantharellus anzutake]KAF8340457.1 hypothetical protein EI90DRAFT_3035624 [Cantharellus anzutake]